MKKNLELYVHIPFCIRKCAYCDFLSMASTREQQKEYVKALEREILAAGELPDYEVSTVFFGGGTPSVPDAEDLVKILELLQHRFPFSEHAEITLEANPGTLTRRKLELYRKAGFNRISLGCQSVHDEELKVLGRIHSFEEFLESWQMAREAGFANINVDLMSGLPGQTQESWEKSLTTIARLNPEHISAYSLIIEPGTPFASRKLDLPDEETERKMYECTGEILGSFGYTQYEISNYAKPGFACRHNIGYWKRTEYLGFGPGAASLLDNCRFTNTTEIERYLRESGRPDQIRESQEQLSEKDCMEEFMFLGLRMMEGISEAEFQKLFHRPPGEVYGHVLEKYLKSGFLWKKDGRIGLTREGISVSNVVMTEFLL